MKTVEVSTGEKYNIVIADGILEKCGEMIREVTSAKTAFAAFAITLCPLWTGQEASLQDHRKTAALPCLTAMKKHSK